MNCFLHIPKANNLWLCSYSSAPAPAPSQQTQLPQLVDPVDSRDWEDYGMDPDGPDSPHASDDIDLALAALMKGMPDIVAHELETLLNDLPMPEPGAKDGISVKEAVEVSTHAI